MSRQDCYQDQQWSAQLSASDDSREQKALVWWLHPRSADCLFIHPHDVFEHICTKMGIGHASGLLRALAGKLAGRGNACSDIGTVFRRAGTGDVLICTSGTSINMSKRSSIGPDILTDTACCTPAHVYTPAPDHRDSRSGRGSSPPPAEIVPDR